jgi:membrane-associated phospholipid phosphatase
VPRQAEGRRPAVVRVIGGLLLGTLAVLGSAILFGWLASVPAVVHLDRALLGDLAARHDPAFAGAFRWLTWLGDARIVSPIAAVLCGILVLRHQLLPAATVAIAVWGGLVVSLAAKAIVARERPTSAGRLDHVVGSSLPSTHAALAVVLFGVVAWLVTPHVGAVAIRASIWGTAGLLAAAVGVSRVSLGVHWPTDVLSGWCLGVGWEVTCILVAKRSLLSARDATRPPSRGERDAAVAGRPARPEAEPAQATTGSQGGAGPSRPSLPRPGAWLRRARVFQKQRGANTHRHNGLEIRDSGIDRASRTA